MVDTVVTSVFGGETVSSCYLCPTMLVLGNTDYYPTTSMDCITEHIIFRDSRIRISALKFLVKSCVEGGDVIDINTYDEQEVRKPLINKQYHKVDVDKLLELLLNFYNYEALSSDIRAVATFHIYRLYHSLGHSPYIGLSNDLCQKIKPIVTTGGYNIYEIILNILMDYFEESYPEAHFNKGEL